MDLEFTEIAMNRGHKAATSTLNFSVRSGSTTALLGSSQSGKSTLLLYASGQIKADSGGIWLVTDENRVSPDWRTVGIGPIADFAPLFETLTVQEHILFQGKLYRQRAARRKTEELLNQYELFELRRERVKDLDRFAYARLSLAIATVHKPVFVLLDEPELGLAESEWLQIQSYIRKLNSDNIGVLYTTVLESAAQCADQIVHLASGEVQQQWPYSQSSVSSGDAFGATN